MRAIGSILAALILGLGSTQWVYASAASNQTATDKQAAASAAELKGDLARIHKNFDAAIGDYQTAIRLDPRNAMLYNKVGIARLQLRDHGGARKAFKRAIDLEPHNPNFLNNMGALYYLDKKYNDSLRYLKQALALDENNAACHLNIAEAWLGLGQMDRAMTEYARALELDADILTSSEDGVVAQVRTPEQRARIDYLIAKAYARRGNVEGALEYLKRAKDGHYADLHKLYDDQDFATVWGDPRLVKIVKK
jgi:Flp pilus assembly protein TadD